MRTYDILIPSDTHRAGLLILVALDTLLEQLPLLRALVVVLHTLSISQCALAVNILGIPGVQRFNKENSNRRLIAIASSAQRIHGEKAPSPNW